MNTQKTRTAGLSAASKLTTQADDSGEKQPPPVGNVPSVLRGTKGFTINLPPLFLPFAFGPGSRSMVWAITGKILLLPPYNARCCNHTATPGDTRWKKASVSGAVQQILTFTNSQRTKNTVL